MVNHLKLTLCPNRPWLFFFRVMLSTTTLWQSQTIIFSLPPKLGIHNRFYAPCKVLLSINIVKLKQDRAARFFTLKIFPVRCPGCMQQNTCFVFLEDEWCHNPSVLVFWRLRNQCLFFSSVIHYTVIELVVQGENKMFRNIYSPFPISFGQPFKCPIPNDFTWNLISLWSMIFLLCFMIYICIVFSSVFLFKCDFRY